MRWEQNSIWDFLSPLGALVSSESLYGNRLSLSRPSSNVTQPPVATRATIALGGGGARGMAHLGAMRAIGESPVEVERLVGVSMGALVGAVCAIDNDVNGATNKARAMLGSEVFQNRLSALLGAQSPSGLDSSGGVFSWYGRLRGYLSAHRKLTRAVTTPALISDAPLVHAIEHLVPDINIEDTKVPLSIVTIDLVTGHRVVLEKGSLRLAVRASMAIPGIFPPVAWGDAMLCDIGVIESLPAMIASSMATELTIAVDVGLNRRTLPLDKHGVGHTALDVMMRFDDVGEQLVRRHALRLADILIRPNVGERPWFDFSEPENLIQAGYEAGKKSLAPLRAGAASVA